MVRAGNIVISLPNAVALSARVLAQVGEASEALTRLREGERFLQRDASREIVGNSGGAYYLLGRASLLLGRLASRPGRAAHALHLLGDVATHPDRFDAERGEAHYRKALALAEPRGMRPTVAHCHLGLGKLYSRRGERPRAQQHLTTAARMHREMDMRFWLEPAEAELEKLS